MKRSIRKEGLSETFKDVSLHIGMIICESAVITIILYLIAQWLFPLPS